MEHPGHQRPHAVRGAAYSAILALPSETDLQMDETVAPDVIDQRGFLDQQCGPVIDRTRAAGRRGESQGRKRREEAAMVKDGVSRFSGVAAYSDPRSGEGADHRFITMVIERARRRRVRQAPAVG